MRLHVVWLFSTSLILPPLLPVLHFDSIKVRLQKERKCVPCVSQSREASSLLLLLLSETKCGTTSHWAQPCLSPTHTDTHVKHWREETRQRERACKRIQASLSLSLTRAPSSFFLLFFFLSPHSEPSAIFLMYYTVNFVTSPAFVYSFWLLSGLCPSIHLICSFPPLAFSSLNPLLSFLTHGYQILSNT